METVWRLMWALPLVLVIGAVAAVVLRRFVVPSIQASKTARLALRESMPLSKDTRVYLIEIDNARFVVVESARTTVLHPMQSDAP